MTIGGHLFPPRDRSHHSIYTIQNDSISLEDFLVWYFVAQGDGLLQEQRTLQSMIKKYLIES